MPNETSSVKSDSNFKIIALISVFLLISLVAILFYFQNYVKNTDSSKGNNNNTSNTEQTDEQKPSTANTTTVGDKTTYTSPSLNYSITYPSDWVKYDQATTNDPSGQEIILLNLEDGEKRDNGKPNIILTAGAPEGFCDAIPDCKQLGPGIFASYKANGDQATIDEVLNSFKGG